MGGVPRRSDDLDARDHGRGVDRRRRLGVGARRILAGCRPGSPACALSPARHAPRTGGSRRGCARGRLAGRRRADAGSESARGDRWCAADLRRGRRGADRRGPGGAAGAPSPRRAAPGGSRPSPASRWRARPRSVWRSRSRAPPRASRLDRSRPATATPSSATAGSTRSCSPGTHNAMSAANSPGWLIPNQDNAIGQQLDDGMRAFKISMHYGVMTSSGRVYTDIAGEGQRLNRVAAKLSPIARLALQRFSRSLSGAPRQGTRDIWLCHTLCELGATRMVDFLGVIQQLHQAQPESGDHPVRRGLRRRARHPERVRARRPVLEPCRRSSRASRSRPWVS